MMLLPSLVLSTYFMHPQLLESKDQLKPHISNKAYEGL